MRFRYGLLTGVTFFAIAALSLPGIAGAAPKDAGDRYYEGMKRFSHVYDFVRRSYVREPTNDELMTGAIKGMLQGLDPHSSYLTPAEYTEMRETTSGEFVGIGIEISQENGQLIVVAPIADTPAEKAGLQSGDLILAVDSFPTQDLTLQEAVSKIRGVKGTEVELLILPKGSSAPKTVRIERDAIPLTSVRARAMGPGYTWIRVARFSDNTLDELETALAEAQKDGEGNLKGVILDLRNNPGGLLDQAYKVADLFLRSGAIVSIKGREAADTRDYTARDRRGDIHVPMVVLINAGSASASEIVAGALQDHKRALIMGERSFGKGSVQNVIPLPDGAGLKLTVALYYTPSGRSIQAEGIEPDMLVPFELPREDADTPRFMGLREQDLSRHLENGDGDGEDAPAERPAPSSLFAPATNFVSTGDEESDAFLARDNQLRMALEMVKALPRLQEIKPQ